MVIFLNDYSINAIKVTRMSQKSYRWFLVHFSAQDNRWTKTFNHLSSFNFELRLELVAEVKMLHIFFNFWSTYFCYILLEPDLQSGDMFWAYTAELNV